MVMSKFSEIERFIEIVARLRAPGGCPWDLEQTHASLKPYLLEETHEVLDAIDEEDPEHLKEELGDLLLQIVLHAQVAADDGKFTIEDVAREVAEKMIRRHPHVFGNTEAKDASAVVKNWDEIKIKEKQTQNKPKAESILDEVPRALPALFEAQKISKKAAKLGFDWDKPADIFDKIEEEILEIKAELKANAKDELELEFGDLLFAVANLCRAHDINPELALKKSSQKFRTRFAQMEAHLNEHNQNPKDLSLEQWNQLWNNAKK